MVMFFSSKLWNYCSLFVFLFFMHDFIFSLPGTTKSLCWLLWQPCSKNSKTTCTTHLPNCLCYGKEQWITDKPVWFEDHLHRYTNSKWILCSIRLKLLLNGISLTAFEFISWQRNNVQPCTFITHSSIELIMLVLASLNELILITELF